MLHINNQNVLRYDSYLKCLTCASSTLSLPCCAFLVEAFILDYLRLSSNFSWLAFNFLADEDKDDHGNARPTRITRKTQAQPVIPKRTEETR